MESICIICEEKCKADRLSDLADLATVFYNLTTLQISELKDKHLLKICKLCKEKLLQCDAFRELCLKACTKLTQQQSLSPVKLEDISEDKLLSDDESLHESKSTMYCKLENPSGILDVNEDSFSNDYASDLDSSSELTKSRNDPIAHQQNRSRKNPFECHVCGKKFLSPIRFEGHIRTHEGLKPAPCKICGKEFSTFRNHKMHMLHKHMDVPREMLTCDFQDCNLTFATKQGLILHQKRHEPEYTAPEPNPVVCETCGRKFSSKGALKKHSYIHTGNMPFHCEVCNKGFPTAYKLKQHTSRQNCNPNDQAESETIVKLEQSVNDSQFSSNESSDDLKLTIECKLESLDSKSDAFEKHVLNEHVSGEEDYGSDVDYFNYSTETEDDAHSGQQTSAKEGMVDSLECTLCGKRFRNPIRFEGHLRTHQGLKPGLCKQCGKEFTTYHNLKMHMLHKHTEIPRKKFPCDFEGCESLFATKQGLVLHRRRHDPGYTMPEPKTFVCETCGKTFSSSGSLKTHSYTHNGNMPFPCTICDKKYPTAHTLKEHTMRHKGIKIHACPQCGLKKTTMHELRVHMNYHTKDKQFPCEFCEHVFLNKGNLQRHIRIVHQKMKSYNCTHCSQSFGKAETLKHHIMTHTGEKPHACTVCGKRFIQLVALRKHANVHTKNERRMTNESPSTE